MPHYIFTWGVGDAEEELAYLAAQIADDGVETHLAFTRGGPNFKIMKESNVIL